MAKTNASIILSGETGTGKEVVARTIHDMSRRSKAPFLPLNCGAVSANLIESELFGHERGSFTGADKMHRGYFERAHGGTLFLDEIAEMPMDLQVRLLRVLETSAVSRVGGSDSFQVDVRIIAASNQRIEYAVTAGKLREDLLYRLNTFQIEIPPLRKRAGDVELLAESTRRLGGSEMAALAPPGLCDRHRRRSSLSVAREGGYGAPAGGRSAPFTKEPNLRHDSENLCNTYLILGPGAVAGSREGPPSRKQAILGP